MACTASLHVGELPCYAIDVYTPASPLPAFPPAQPTARGLTHPHMLFFVYDEQTLPHAVR